MSTYPQMPYSRAAHRVAVVRWAQIDELSDVICDGLKLLGYDATSFFCNDVIPADCEFVFSFAPYGNFMGLVDRIDAIPVRRRPLLIHWNTEGLPDLKLPWSVVYPIGYLRSWVGRMATRANLYDRPPYVRYKDSMARFCHVGDYHRAYQRGLLSVYADSSTIYADIHRSHGLPTTYFPWGAAPTWYANLDLPRDVDVLWLGARGTKRRSDLLDRVRRELNRHGIDIYVVDNVEHPFVWDVKRNELISRAKIVLNITRTWYDDNFSRFAMAAPNRSLIVSEPMLPHCTEYKAGEHYISTPIEMLSTTILHYLEAEDERRTITNSAYTLVTQELTLTSGLRRVMTDAEAVLAQR